MAISASSRMRECGTASAEAATEAAGFVCGLDTLEDRRCRNAESGKHGIDERLIALEPLRSASDVKDADDALLRDRPPRPTCFRARDTARSYPRAVPPVPKRPPRRLVRARPESIRYFLKQCGQGNSTLRLGMRALCSSTAVHGLNEQTRRRNSVPATGRESWSGSSLPVHAELCPGAVQITSPWMSSSALAFDLRPLQELLDGYQRRGCTHVSIVLLR